jgi:monovalent cation/hydrogen antiporter
VMPVIERLGVPRRIATIISDESLVNDAVSLVIYRLAAAAVVAGSFSLVEGALEFVLVSVGGVAIGLAVGWLAARLLRRLDDPPVEITLSLLLPFLAYLSAEKAGTSGVLAVVALGIYMGRQGSTVRTPETRLEARAFWQVLVFLLNGFLFILVGLQLPAIRGDVARVPLRTVAANAVAISLTCVIVRILWVYGSIYLPRRLSRRLRERDPAPSWQNAAVIAWTGIRGGLSLAAALAIPLTVRSGAPFPQRERIVFLTFSVILTTLVLQGATLPYLIRGLHVRSDRTLQEEENAARLKATEAALARLEGLSAEAWVTPEVAEHLRGHYTRRLRLYRGRAGGVSGGPHEARSQAYHRLQRELLEAEHDALIRMRDEGALSDEALRLIERDLDLERVRLDQALPDEKG